MAFTSLGNLYIAGATSSLGDEDGDVILLRYE